MDCARKGDLPPRLHYGRNPRVPAFICIAKPGWLIAGMPPTPDRPFTAGGQHGYDPAIPEMAAVFVASGPAFRAGIVLPGFDNVDVYPLLARLIGVTARASDGSIMTFEPALKP